MKFKKTKFGNKSERLNFGKINSKIEIPNLVAIQTDAFNWLLKEGIDAIFKSIFPIKKEGLAELTYGGCSFKDPKITLEDAKLKDATYSQPLYAKIILNNDKSGETKTDNVFFGDFPIMTEKGTFLVNGSERVIVSQLVRSAGVHYHTKRKPTGIDEEYIVIPTRGSWIEYLIINKKPIIFSRNKNDVVITKEQQHTNKFYIKLDRTKRLLVPTLFLALGVSIKKQEELFGHSPIFKNTLSVMPGIQIQTDDEHEAMDNALFDLYSKIKPGEPATISGTVNLLTSKYFNVKRYDLGISGRYKFNTKLAVWKRIEGTYLCHDLKLKNKVILLKGTLLEGADFLKAKQALEDGANYTTLAPNGVFAKLTDYRIQVLEIAKDEELKNRYVVVGNDQDVDSLVITISDIIASFSYLVNLKDELCTFDHVDNLENRRIRTVGELTQNQFRIGLSRIEKNILQKMTSVDAEKMTPKNIINIKPLTSAIREFFLTSQLSQFMDQTNPQSELSNKRRISALGPGGLSRNFAGTDVRDVNYSHYGRICPIETPEGPNVGLINNLALYGQINKYGFIETPYRQVKKQGKAYYVTNKIDYLSAGEEFEYIISHANIKLDSKGKIIDEEVVARHKGDNILTTQDKVDYVDVAANQILSIASACIPFLEHDDATRAAMGANMQRQAVPLLKPDSPIVGTGLEYIAARYSGMAHIALCDGEVVYVDSTKITIKGTNRRKINHKLIKFNISNQGTWINQVSIVEKGEMVKKGDIIADGPSIHQGELALGQNVLVAFMTWKGYNYEDAIIISERLVKDDVYTSIHIQEYIIECHSTPQGDEEITAGIPNVSAISTRHLDERGIVQVGSEVKEGDVLVGKISPKAQIDVSPEEKLLHAIFGEKSKNIKDSSLKVPYGAEGIVQAVKIFKNSDSKLMPGVNQVVKVYIAQKRKIQEGDKIAGRHGNKGVISIVLPEEDMPIMPDGKPIDVLLNPLGVPSRMNIGQILEIHLGMAAQKLGFKVATPAFDGCEISDLNAIMKKANMDQSGKFILRDGMSGKPFGKPISVGIMYILKLSHMVDDKLHARSTGPYSIITQQPLGGKAQKGGQRFGEMEVWALEAYGAAYTLQELLTIKSDDIDGRTRTYDAILRGHELPKIGIPESFNVLKRELQALSLDLRINTKGPIIEDDEELGEI